ncbi:hypothetical protein [Kitasatospora sp. KL5]|uniref:hypothetical protein n=1 Tax=Kitasatospora sp. KL5 TaxID=3425125 RepID=UPI003D6DD135
MDDRAGEPDAVFRRVVERGVADGEFSCENINVAMQCLHGVLNQSAVWLRPGLHVDDRGEMRAALVACALRLFG